MTRPPGAMRPAGRNRSGLAVAAGLVLAAAGWAGPTHAAGPPLQFATSRLDLPALPPDEGSVTPPADGTPLYERAPMPNANAFEPQYDSGASDPVQPSVISRGSKATESGGYSRNSSANSAQESRMKPGLGFALHVPTE